MEQRKSERLVNLTICLLVSRRFLSREQIRQAVEGYHGLPDQAFERTFERDKNDLRRMGVPVETGSDDPLFDDEPGYRIRRSDFELPPVSLTSDELSVLGAATRVWQEASTATSTSSALAKLRSAGVEPDTARLTALEPAVSTEGPAFDVLWTATRERQVVEFRYRGGQTRHLEPWGMTWRSGHWYVVGRDRDRGEPRIFRLSRIQGLPKARPRADAFRVPDDVDPAQLARKLEPGEPDATAVVAIRTGWAPLLRRQGRPVPTPAGVTLPPGYEAVEIDYNSAGDLTGQICASAPYAIPLSPPEVCDRVADHLRATAALVASEECPA